MNITDPPAHPVHHLQDDRSLLQEISSITKRVFSTPLTLDTLARLVQLRVGEMTLQAPTVDNVSREYIDAMARLQPLDAQGDGMRSLLGQLMPIITGGYPIVVIDEPEAFLHPPQAHALGAELGRLAVTTGTQVILATHDRSLVAGLLASGASTSVVRLSRRGEDASVAAQLDPESLKALWADPVLKYTNVLDGLFHQLVVLAEAEGDCGYLAAGLDCPGRVRGIPANEVLFVPTGGKDGMAKVASALRAVEVPVVAAPDLDRLSDVAMLRKLVESVGSVWGDSLQAEWNRATADLRAKKEPALVSHVLDAINGVLDQARDQAYASDHREAVMAQLRVSDSPWKNVKDFGLAAFKGEARASAERLLQSLDALGVVLVREGELERLAPEVTAAKGPGWLQAALRAGAQCNAATQAHLDRILASGLRDLVS